jgi:hypothetical protein
MSFLKNGAQESKTGTVWWLAPRGGGEHIRNGCRGVIMVEIFCTLVWKWRREISWNCSKNGEGGIKENDDEGSEPN